MDVHDPLGERGDTRVPGSACSRRVRRTRCPPPAGGRGARSWAARSGWSAGRQTAVGTPRSRARWRAIASGRSETTTPRGPTPGRPGGPGGSCRPPRRAPRGARSHRPTLAQATAAVEHGPANPGATLATCRRRSGAPRASSAATSTPRARRWLDARGVDARCACRAPCRCGARSSGRSACPSRSAPTCRRPPARGAHRSSSLPAAGSSSRWSGRSCPGAGPGPPRERSAPGASPPAGRRSPWWRWCSGSSPGVRRALLQAPRFLDPVIAVLGGLASAGALLSMWHPPAFARTWIGPWVAFAGGAIACASTIVEPAPARALRSPRS